MNTIPEIIQYIEDWFSPEYATTKVIEALIELRLPSGCCEVDGCGTTEFLCGHNKRD